MCGIVGFYGNISNKKQILADMMQSIKHRGPDDEGFFYHNNIALGHVRLSIIDIESGKQPISSNDGRYTLIFNGEIYNYIELRQSLNAKGYRFKTHSDSEVLLYLYIEHKEKCLNYLNGMFAFAIYDSKEDEIFLARDHFGIKPLYYFSDKENFVFGSEIKALLKHPIIKSECDYKSLQEYLTFQMVLKKHTLFKDILKLEPGHYIKVKKGQIIDKQEYWDLKYIIDDSKSEERFSDELLILLENSLSMQIRSDVPVGAYLSGGLDSSAVSVLASKNYMGQLKTFTGGFNKSPIYDESNYAKIVSKAINSEYFDIYPDYNDFADNFEKLIYHMDEPVAGPGLFPQYMVSKLAGEHVKVVLGGQGGDEIFGGYARYAVAYLEQCLKGAIFETQEEGNHVVTLQQIIKNLPMLQQYVPMIKNQFSRGMFNSMEERYFNIINRSQSLNSLYSTEILNNRDNKDIYNKFLQIFNKPDTPSYFNKMTHFDTKTLLPGLLQVEDRVSMAVSIESRVPLLDRRIVELTASMPPTMKFAGGKTKYMLNKALRNVLPHEIIQRKDKMGFPVPINEWFAGPLKEYILDIFNSKATKERGLYNHSEIIKQIDKEGKFNRDLWGALNLEVWFRTFID